MEHVNKAINFCDGKICIKNEDNTLCFQDDVCILEILSEIDEYILANPKQMRVFTIVFDVLKSHFNVYDVFWPKNSYSFQPNDDPLYNAFSKHVRENPIYSARIDELLKLNKKKLRNDQRKKRQLKDY